MNHLINNITPYIPSNGSSLCLLDTDIMEPELLVRMIGDIVSKKYPECFQGEEDMVFFRLRYTPPYERFTEIKRLILQIRQATGIRSRFRGMICIDASDYKGHEDEEYFTILLKYLYDKAHDDSVILVCSQYSEQEIGRLSNVCMKYYSLHRERMQLFEMKSLSKLIELAGNREGVVFEEYALKLTVMALSSPLLSPNRSLQLINRIPGELRMSNQIKTLDNNSQNKISVKVVRDYFSNASTPICMLAGKALLEKRRSYIEQTL